MTEIRILRNGVRFTLRTEMNWERALDILGRAFCPDKKIGGPELPKPQEKRR